MCSYILLSKLHVRTLNATAFVKETNMEIRTWSKFALQLISAYSSVLSYKSIQYEWFHELLRFYVHRYMSRVRYELFEHYTNQEYYAKSWGQQEDYAFSWCQPWFSYEEIRRSNRKISLPHILRLGLSTEKMYEK